MASLIVPPHRPFPPYPYLYPYPLSLWQKHRLANAALLAVEVEWSSDGTPSIVDADLLFKSGFYVQAVRQAMLAMR